MSDDDTKLSDKGRFDVRPVVASTSTNRGIWLFGGGLALAGLLLFQALESRRAAVTAPAIAAPRDITGSDAGFPRLVIPPEPQILAASAPARQGVRAEVPLAPQRLPQLESRSRSLPYAPAAAAAQGQGYGPGFAPYKGSEASQSVSYPAKEQVAGPASSAPADVQALAASSKDRVKAARFLNPATTVPKGTVIQAVLETALDSTRGGFARALVSRDISGFDGSKVLIQRGSRILGEYKSDVSLGQKRVLIQWQRLTRPDGVIIDLDSPSADPLGRAGTGGKVDTHFFERFSGAILQSTLTIGAQLAARAASRDTIVLALPGSVQQGLGGGQGIQPERIAPTVTVKQGSSVSVFVARDLDFTDTDK